MFPFLTLFIIFIIILNLAIRKSKQDQDKLDQEFWNREFKANATRKQDISKLNYITIPCEKIPQNLNTDAGKKLLELSSRKMLNLASMSNTDLKLQYGVANFEALSQYDANFSDFVATASTYARELIEAGEKEEAIHLLELVRSYGADSTALYMLLASLYIEDGHPELVRQLQEDCLGYDTISSRITLQKLQELLEKAEA